MAGKSLTQRFPFLLPLRQKQRKWFYYAGMRLDSNRYARRMDTERLPFVLFEARSQLINLHTGCDMQLQKNKVFNLKLAARTIDHVVVEPGETFSFYWLARHADREQPYREGLALRYGKLVGSYGGGLCQLSNLLYWAFLHTPLTVTERHGHRVEAFPSADSDLPQGVDATLNEGWKDLRARNDTGFRMQIEIDFDERHLIVRMRSDRAARFRYDVFNEDVRYIRRDGHVIQRAPVCRRERDLRTGRERTVRLYVNETEIGYPLPEDTPVEEADE